MSSTVFDFRSAFEYGGFKMKSYKRSDYKSAFTYQGISMPFEDEEECSKETLPLLVFRNAVTYFLYTFVILLFPLSFWLCFKRAHSLERIVLMRLGKLQPIRGPGLVCILPCIDVWTRVDLHPQNFSIPSAQLLTSDGGIVEVTTDIEYHISGVIEYVVRLRQQESTLKELALTCLTRIVSGKEQADLESKRDILKDILKEELNSSAIQWGLEVDHVDIHSLKILKAAEPVDALGTLMNALRATTSSSTMPLLAPHMGVSDCSRDADANPCTLISFDDERNDCVTRLKELADYAMKESFAPHLNATCRFDIIGSSTKTVYLAFYDGAVSVVEDGSLSASDVQLQLSEETLQKFLSGQLSPLQAYTDGKVVVTGDWTLLTPLSTLLDKCRKV